MKIEIRQGSKEISIPISVQEEKDSLLEILRKNQIEIQANCGGKGRCGKCRVQFLNGAHEPLEQERQVLSKDEIKKGWRLACLSFASKNAVIYVPETNEDAMEVQAECSVDEVADDRSVDNNADYGIAIDIGTTTIAISLVNILTKKTVDTYTTVNHQRRWGADVISRIQAATEGHLKEMTQSIRDDLRIGIEELVTRWNLTIPHVKKIVIAGNTTMGHLFCGFPCESLGVAPFTPVDISMIQRNASDIFGWKDSLAEVILVPGISTYVGADITAGMYVTGMHEAEGVCLLIDLGTNGEMAIGNKKHFMVTSTAAGPAFEGGNISCGVASVPGAICHVVFEGEQIKTETIGDETPVGLCGTGVIETVYELNQSEWMDETGALEEEYFEEGICLAYNKDSEKITFLQEDIREIQLAKSAVRAGLESLILKFGTSYEEIAHVYIAGGFGYKMDLTKAAGIGMLPEELLPKMKAVGNTSLGGALAGLLEESALCKMEQIANSSKEVNLATTKEFSEFYMEYMLFEE